jgi:hypothetical protein
MKIIVQRDDGSEVRRKWPSVPNVGDLVYLAKGECSMPSAGYGRVKQLLWMKDRVIVELERISILRRNELDGAARI